MWYQTLDSKVQEFVHSDQIQESLSNVESEARRKLALLLQNDETYSTKFILKGTSKVSRLEAAILLHWYLPSWLGFELREALLDRVRNDLDEESKAWCLELLSSKYVCLYYLGPQLSQNDFHGNVVRTMKEILLSLEYRAVLNREPRRQVRRRGYQDHGSLRLAHQWKERHPWTDFEYSKLLESEEKNWELIRHSLPMMKMIFRKTG